jgi:hypothetical protein
MNSIWKVGAAAVTVALLGGFYLGRVASDQGPLPAVGQPVTVGATVEPTPSAAQTTLRPRPEKTTPGRPEGPRSPDDDQTTPDDDFGDDDNSGRGRGRGRGGDDDGVQTISPPVVTPDDDEGFDDHGGGSNSGPG